MGKYYRVEASLNWRKDNWWQYGINKTSIKDARLLKKEAKNDIKNIKVRIVKITREITE